MDVPPIIKLEVEHLKSSIIHHLGIAGSKLSEQLQVQVDEAVRTYPWQRRVEEVVHKALDSALQAYWGYGAGYKAVRDAVEAGLKAAGAPVDGRE